MFIKRAEELRDRPFLQTWPGPSVRIVSLWINGIYFHNDADAALLERLFPDVGVPLARLVFENYVLTATQIVLLTASLLERARDMALLQTNRGWECSSAVDEIAAAV